MTGANRGIGRVAGERILRASGDVRLVVVVRESSAARLSAELGTGGRSVSYAEADLGSLESVRSAAAGIRGRLDRGDLPPPRGFACFVPPAEIDVVACKPGFVPCTDRVLRRPGPGGPLVGRVVRPAARTRAVGRRRTDVRRLMRGAASSR
jgi:NAD(P)-dependent dehydrogenase (short-subunit alcohol dehydrogenase family)